MKTLFSALSILLCLSLTSCDKKKIENNLENNSAPAQEKINDSRVDQTKVLIVEVGKAIQIYFMDCGVYPERLEHLVTNPKTCINWGPTSYIENLKDAWDEEFIYKKTGKMYDLISLGADKAKGGVGIDEDLTFLK